ncbi:hypothetical protein FB446DRAFT_706633 [Lentinula raphanica]|nr:hypothetical protein FB446DRAFT_706633 [Lentinula raphanica]
MTCWALRPRLSLIILVILLLTDYLNRVITLSRRPPSDKGLTTSSENFLPVIEVRRNDSDSEVVPCQSLQNLSHLPEDWTSRLSQIMPYNCVPGCPAGPWSVKHAATLHRNSCPKWNDYYASKRKLDSDIDNSSSGSDTPSVRPRIDIAARKALERRRKKARLQDSSTTAGTALDMSAQAGPSNIHQDPGKTTRGNGDPSSDIGDIDKNLDSVGVDITSAAPIISGEGSGQLVNSLASASLSAAPDAAGESSSPNIPEETNVEPESTTATGRPQRNRRLPARYWDILPEGITAIVEPPSDDEDPEPDPPPTIRRITFRLRERLKTSLNSFQLWREYPQKPSHDPDGEVSIEDLSNLPTQQSSDDDDSSSELESDSPLNPTQALLTGWQNNGNSTKSHGEMNLLADIIQRPDFQVAELQGYSAQAANAKLTKADEDWDHNKLKDSFTETSVDIEVPSGDKNIPPKTFSIPGLLYRTPLSVIRAAFTGPLGKHFHFTPFRLFQKLPSSDDSQHEEGQRVYTDLYNSDAFLREHDRVQRAPTDDPECKREKVVAALMCWSDATQLANFGTAKLWPIYMLFGNLSKYLRASPSSGAVNHLAYIPVIPDSIKEEIAAFHAKRKADILTHCNRELYHAVWRHLLDDDFIHAYRYGVVIKCFDGHERRIYPRFFTYSADYPEKVKTARDLIYRKGYGIRSAHVERLLKETSSVPTMNAFVERLGSDFNPLSMLAPDFMHEFELGVFKSLFAHLIRILYAKDHTLFRQVPTFGFDTIRLFANNASEMKQLAARDYEDILQCSIPVFDGLLGPDDNKPLMELLYRAAEYHALAKLRLHTENTLDYLEKRTQAFGKLMRKFRDTAGKFKPKETECERIARNRRAAEQATSSASASIDTQHRRPKSLNLFTYKWHGMMDDVPFIRLFGPTDSYSTQLGELAHRVVKKLYGLGNKKKDPRQIGRRLRRVEWAKRALNRRAAMNKGDSITARYHIAKSNKNRSDLRKYTNSGDPAAKEFWPKLQDHLLGRLMNREFDGDTHESFTDEDRNFVRIKDQKLTELQTLRVNYTTYDVRRDQDTINPRTHADVMVLSPEDGEGAHPYWYARVLRIFRVQVISTHPQASTIHSGPQEIEVLWVRWLGVVPGYRSGPQYARLPKVGFVDEGDPFAFGFLDPSHVIRGCHLIPAFHDKRTSSLLQTSQPTVARKADEVDDWQCFYVGIFVDRDMYMRYFPGGGVGHVTNTKSNSEIRRHQLGINDSDESGDEEDELADSDTPLSPTGSSTTDIGGEGSSQQSDESEQELGPSSPSKKEEEEEGIDSDDSRWGDGYASV